MPILKEEGLRDILFQKEGVEHLFICTLQWLIAGGKFHGKGPAETALTWPPRFPDLRQIDFL
jgi:hypothetical protein